MITDKSNLAPIVVFAYNRPDHIKSTLEALAKNNLSDQSELFVFIDGAKSSKDKCLNDKVLKICKEFDWPGTKKIITKRKENWGLAKNIIEGVTQLSKEKGKVIVLEDDIETSPGFLQYMNAALQYYQNDERVMHISGYMFPIKNINFKQKTFFYQSTSCWGWATWYNRWINFESDPVKLFQNLEKDGIMSWFDLDNSQIFKSQLELNISGELNTWAIKWQASVNLLQGLSLHPAISLTRNIGCDGSGENCGESNIYSNQKLAENIEIKKIPVRLNNAIRKKMIVYYKGTKIVRLKTKLKSFISKAI